jgi:uncharacterized membrane protein
MNSRRKWKLPHPVYIFLVIPYIALLWTPFYNRHAPDFFGIPFFYWYQIVWTPITALMIVPVYLHQKRRK